MKSINHTISLILLSFTGFYAYLIWKLPSRDLPHTLGAGFVPWVLAGCLFILSLCLFVNGFSKQKDPEEKIRLPLKGVAGITGLLALIILYIQAMIYIGFLISTGIFLIILTLISGSRKPIEILIFSSATTAAVYFLFYHFFNIQLPEGLIF